MTVNCPQGHASESTDYCDICGEPIGARSSGPDENGGASGATPPPAPAGPTTCPHCGFPATAAALFCENCGYDFTTGSAPEPASSLDLPAVAPSLSAPSLSAPSPSAPSPSAPDPVPSTGPGVPGDPTGPVPSTDPGPGPTASGPSGVPAATGGDPAPHDPAPHDPDEPRWVAEVWIDPDWYAAQEPSDPMPSAGLPGLVVLRERSLLVGRPSVSRGIHPQIDCGADSGVSRRHCQLTTDGQRWWVEDLQSSNGTYVGLAGDPLPTDPIAPGTRRELEEGDRIFLGAWTRLVVREALPGEV